MGRVPEKSDGEKTKILQWCNRQNKKYGYANRSQTKAY